MCDDVINVARSCQHKLADSGSLRPTQEEGTVGSASSPVLLETVWRSSTSLSPLSRVDKQ